MAIARTTWPNPIRSPELESGGRAVPTLGSVWRWDLCAACDADNHAGISGTKLHLQHQLVHRKNYSESNARRSEKMSLKNNFDLSKKIAQKVLDTTPTLASPKELKDRWKTVLQRKKFTNMV